MIYTRELTDDEIQALEHLVPDAKEWIDTAINEKIANCKKRLVREYVDKAIEKNTPLPSDASAIVSAIVTDKDYRNRKQRDEDSGPVKIEPQPVDEVPIEPSVEEIGDGQPA